MNMTIEIQEEGSLPEEEEIDRSVVVNSFCGKQF